MTPRFVTAFAGCLLTFNAVSCDIVLPAFFEIHRDLGNSIEHVQAIVPIFLMAAAIGQLVFGPMSDRFGRRPVLLGGVAVYVVGSIAAGFASSLGTLYAARVLQGLGGACGIVLSRAIMRDSFAGTELARALSVAMAVFAVGPFVAPMIGALVTGSIGWRGTFLVLTVYGATIWLTTWIALSETNHERDPGALSLHRLKSALVQVLSNRQSRYFIVVAILIQASVATLVINAPRIVKISYDIEGAQFALMFGAMACGVVVGQFASHRALSRLGVLGTIRAAGTIMFADTLLLMLLARFDHLGIAALVGLLTIFSASFLTVMSNSISLVIGPHSSIAGFASSIYGFLTQFVGSALALLLLPWINGSLVRWTVLLAAIAGMVLAAVVAYRASPLQSKIS